MPESMFAETAVTMTGYRFFAPLYAVRDSRMPQYITSNPMIATAYAEMIFGFLQDRANKEDQSEPVFVVELGAGAGRLAYQPCDA